MTDISYDEAASKIEIWSDSVMVVAASPPFETLSLPQGEWLFADITQMQTLLTELQGSALRKQLDINHDLSQLQRLWAEITAAQTLSPRLEIHQQHYRPLAFELKEKYGALILDEQWIEIAQYESYIEAIRQIDSIQADILTIPESQYHLSEGYGAMYRALVKLASILDLYISYFSPGLLQSLKKMITQISDYSAFQNSSSEYHGVSLPCPISITNTARAILWQLTHLSTIPSSAIVQIQKNRAAIEQFKYAKLSV